MTELLRNVDYLEIVLLVSVVFALVSVFVVQQNTKKKRVEIEKKIAALQRHQEEISEGLDNQIASLKEDIDDTSNKVVMRINELVKKVNTALNESKKAIIIDVENVIDPMNASLNETQNSMRESLIDNRKEIKRLSGKLEEFSSEIRRMKDDMRERTIDLEL